jgi:hypothetical protein
LPGAYLLGVAQRESEQTAITRPFISVALLLLVTAIVPAATPALLRKPSSVRTTSQPIPRTVSALGPVFMTRRSHAPASAVVLRDFLLKPSGILFGMHPTEARIVVSGTVAAPLKVCQFGTTFSTYWRGGCRRFIGQAIALPTSGGAVLIGFRVLPSNGRATRKVRPKVTLRKLAPRKFRVTVLAGESYAGKFVLFQRYSLAKRRWITVRSAVPRAGPTLTTPINPTSVSTRTFRVRIKSRLRVRAYLTQAQAGGCYAASASATIRS